jgi:LCP family protein required for cell wall assembly
MLTITAVSIGAVLLYARDRTALASLAVRPTWLLALLGLDVAVLVLRIACVVDAYRLGIPKDPAPAPARRTPQPEANRTFKGTGTIAAPGSHRRWPAAVALALILTVTAVPHQVAGYYDLQAYDLVTSVFGSGQAGWGGSGPQAGPPVATRTPGRLTVLLLGGDAGQGRESLRTDTMIVATVDMATGQAAMFGLPRNTVNVPLPEPAAKHFECECFSSEHTGVGNNTLNALYRFAEEERPEWFPGPRNPGVNAIMGAAEEIVGIPIDHYAMVDLKGFVQVVDALGGVTVNVTKPVRVEVETDIDKLGLGSGGPAFTLKPGRRHLDGRTALAYVRSRKDTSDYDRMKRQRCLLSTLAGQASAGNVLRGFPRLARAVKSNVTTDLPIERLPELIEVAGAGGVAVTTIGITPPEFTDGYRNGYPILDVPRIHKAVRKLIAEPKPKAAAPAPTAGKTPPAGQDDAEPTETTKPKSGSSGSNGKKAGNEVEQSSDACGMS